MSDALNVANNILTICNYSDTDKLLDISENLSTFYFNNIDGFKTNFNPLEQSPLLTESNTSLRASRAQSICMRWSKYSLMEHRGFTENYTGSKIQNLTKSFDWGVVQLSVFHKKRLILV